MSRRWRIRRSHAPALNHPGLKHGDSDLDIYKVVRDGVPDTSMASVPLGALASCRLCEKSAASKLVQARKEIAPLDIRISAEQVLAAGNKTDEWLTYSGSLDGRRYSALAEITPANVSQLQLRWVHQFDSSEPTIEATPIVIDGVIFVTESGSNVVAPGASSGKVICRDGSSRFGYGGHEGGLRPLAHAQ